MSFKKTDAAQTVIKERDNGWDREKVSATSVYTSHSQGKARSFRCASFKS